MQLKILTSSQKEYEQMLKIAKENNIPTISVYAPEDSVASVTWSVDDVREHFPKGTDDEAILEALLSISSSIRDNMTTSGWETIDALKYELLNHIDTKEVVEKSHFSHFILANSEKLKELTSEVSDDYYSDAQVIQDVLNLAIKEYKETDRFKISGIGVADIIYCEDFLNTGIEAYKKRRL